MKRKIEPENLITANNKDQVKRGKNITKLIIFRSLVLLSLTLAAGLCGIFAYLVLDYQESQSFETQYDSLSDQILDTTHNRVLRSRSSLDEIVTMHSIHNPNSSEWPYAFMEGYDYIHEHISIIGNVEALALGPIVEPNQLEDFENYVRDIYLQEPYKSELPENVTLELGVFARGPNGAYRDTTGEFEFSAYNFITPILNVGNLSRSGRALMFNLHSEMNRAEAIDACYECSVRTKKPCTVMTDIIQLVSLDVPRPDTIMVRAVYPFREPEKLVGFQVLSIAWDTMLTGLIPDYVCGLDAVLSTDTQRFTYTLCDGEAVSKCSGDCHQKKFSSYRTQRVLSLFNVEAVQPHFYKLEVYPTQTLYDSYHSNTPWISAMVVVLIIFFTSLVFVFYDFFVAKESREKEQVLEAKRKFVRFVSHEIRTPLSSLVLGLKLLADNVNDLPTELSSKNDLKIMTQELEGCSNVAVMVLNDLLQYDKIETGNLKLMMKEIRIWELIRSNVHLFRSRAMEKQMTLDITLSEPDSLGVIGDELRLAQVIGNIMSNALKFSKISSTVIVRSSREQESNYPPDVHRAARRRRGSFLGNLNQVDVSNKEWVLFSVKDSGPGISTENLQKLFGEGVQFNPNELQGGQGSGLGLWISKGIIELHGGHIWATSEGEGKGCTFFFQLPLVELKDTSSHGIVNLESNEHLAILENRSPSFSTIEPLSSPSVNVAPDRQRHILLIVDDVLMLRKMLSRSLKAKGFDCAEASDGKECVEMIKSGLSVACILMDFQMPFMNGPDATRELRKLGYKMPIVGVTGNVMPEDVAEFMKAGADTVMVKPFKMDLFQEFLTNSTTLLMEHP